MLNYRNRRDSLYGAMRLGFYMGYAPPGTNPVELVELAQEADRLGYHSAWAAEAWGTDAVTVLAWVAATTTRINVGSAILQIPGRTPANTAMTAATLDLMSGGRFLLGLGTSGPQVVEGWHGEAWGKPLAKTREYVEIVRAVLRRIVLPPERGLVRVDVLLHELPVARAQLFVSGGRREIRLRHGVSIA